MRCLAVPLALATLVAIGCGPSIRRVHRSQVYFERCYAADLDERVPVGERRACWQSWLTHYQVGQPPDRIDYVRERVLRLDPERAEVLALATGGEGDPEPEIAAEAEIVTSTVAGEEPISSPEPVEVAVAEPAPGAAPEVEAIPDREPPPRTVPPARERRDARTPPIPRGSSPHCAEACRPGWEACLAGCEGRDLHACQRSCRVRHSVCARGCY